MTDRPPNALPGCSVLPAMQSSKPPADPTPKATGGPPTDKTKGAGKGKSRNTADRFGCINAFVDCSLADLTRAELATWLTLWRDTRNGVASTSTRNIARRIGASCRAVTESLASLQRRGLLSVVHQGGMNRGVSVRRVHPIAPPPKSTDT